MKLPRKGSFKSSIRRTTKSKRSSSKKKPKREDDHTASLQQQTNVPQNILQNVSQNIPQNVQPQPIQQQQSLQSQSSITNENQIVCQQVQQSILQQQQSADTPGVDTSTSTGSSGSTHFTYNTVPSQLSGINDSPPIDLPIEQSAQAQQLQQQNQLFTTNYANMSGCTISNCIHSMPVPHHKSFAIKPIPNANSRPLLVFINPKSGTKKL